MTIETDGTLTAREALENSIAIMINQLHAIAGFTQKKMAAITEEADTESTSKGAEKVSGSGEGEFTDILKTRIDTLDLSTRTLNSLMTANIRTIGGVARKKREDLLEIEGIGEKGIQEIKKVLGNYGITLKE